MKRSQLILSLSAICGVALPIYGVDIVNDTWADGSRTEQNLPTESAWFNAGTGATLTPSVGHLVMGIPASSASWTTYFAADASPVTLSSVGDMIRVTWVFTPNAAAAQNNTSQNFRLGLVDSPNAARVTTDAAPGSAAYAGYAMFMNMSIGPSSALGNANPFRLMERDGTSAALLSASTPPWNPLANGATTGNHGYDSGIQYTFVISLTLNASSGVDIVATMTGGTLDNDGTAQVTFTDTTPNSLTYDTFALRPSNAATTADTFDTTQFRVEFIAVPEPSAFAIVGMGVLTLAAFRFRRSGK